MTTQEKISDLRDRHEDELVELILAALRAEDWSQTRAAARLGCPQSTLATAIARHPWLEIEYAKRGHGRGRPKKAAE